MGNLKSKQSNKLQKKPCKVNNITVVLPLEEVLKNIINKEEQYSIPIFIPHRGCKNECVFCNQRKISGQTKKIDSGEIDRIIQQYLGYVKTAKKKKKIQIAFFGGSFTGINQQDQIAYLTVANKYVTTGQVDSIRISTRPDYISPTIINRMKQYHVSTIELGVQSMDDEVLMTSKRGHTKIDVIRASRLIHLWGIKLGHQMMVGLPQSTPEKEVITIQEILKLKPVDLRVYPVYVIQPSELYDWYCQKRYLPLTLEDAISRVCLILQECLRTNVKIIRMGLHTTDEITANSKEIVGPVCDNFAEYVFARTIRMLLEEQIIQKMTADEMIRGEQNVIILPIDTKYTSMVVGPKRVNILYLEEKYSVYQLKLRLQLKE